MIPCNLVHEKHAFQFNHGVGLDSEIWHESETARKALLFSLIPPSNDLEKVTFFVAVHKPIEMWKPLKVSSIGGRGIEESAAILELLTGRTNQNILAAYPMIAQAA